MVIADRGLARASGLHEVARAGAYSLLRMHWQNIRLEDAEGIALDPKKVLAEAEKGITGTVVYVPLEGAAPLPARLLVKPLPSELAARARAKLRRNASKKGRTPSQLALRLAGYFCLLTTLPLELASDEVVLELYRIRWQIELFFKRCKSLLHLDQLRAVDSQLVQTYWLAKLVEVAMIQLLTQEGEFFSPWGVPRAANGPPSLWRQMHLCRIDLTLAVYGGLSLHQRQQFWNLAVQALSEGRRKKRQPALVISAPRSSPRDKSPVGATSFGIGAI